MQAAWNTGTALASYFMSMELEAQIDTSQGLELQFSPRPLSEHSGCHGFHTGGQTLIFH